jgi:hypothetical protein
MDPTGTLQDLLDRISRGEQNGDIDVVEFQKSDVERHPVIHQVRPGAADVSILITA